MNAVALFMGLLVLSYLGNSVVSRRSAGGVGLPSGVEYVLLGLALGPRALGLVSAADVATFEPVAQVALGWLAFVFGLDFGVARGKPVGAARILLGASATLVAAAAVGAAVWTVAAHFCADATWRDRVLLTGGIAAVCCQTTRHSVDWVVGKQTRGPLADLIDDVAHADDLVPLAGTAILFALAPSSSLSLPVAVRDWPLVTVALGGVLGAGAALLMRSEMSVTDTWSTLFGVSLLVIGTAARFALSTLTASFAMGLTVSTLSSRRNRLRVMVAPTERPVLLPALVIAGARLDFRTTAALPWLAAAAVGARFLAQLAGGWILAVGWRPARGAGPLVGLSFCTSGALSMAIGLAFAFRFPGFVGDSVLAVAVVSAVVGEFVGPARLRRSLQRAREIDPPAHAVEPVSA